MTMHRIEEMEATLAELDSATVAKVFRVMVRNIAYVHSVSGPECTTVEEFRVAVSQVPEAERVYEAIRAQAWDRQHLNAYMTKHGIPRCTKGASWERKVVDRMAVRRHMNGEGIY